MAKFWERPEFKSLEREWNMRLLASGFEDAEKVVGGERQLKQSAEYAYRRAETVEIIRETKLAYFTLLAQRIADERCFEDASDRLIMELTAEGATIRAISQELKRLGMPKSNRDTIRYVRRRYEDRWGIRKWNPRDMVSRKAPTR